MDPGIIAKGVCGGRQVSGNHQLAWKKLPAMKKEELKKDCTILEKMKILIFV